MLLSSSHRALHVNLCIFLPKILADFCPLCLCAAPSPQSETLEFTQVLESLNQQFPTLYYIPTPKRGFWNSLQSMELPWHHPNLKKRSALPIKSQVCHCRGSRQTPQSHRLHAVTHINDAMLY